MMGVDVPEWARHVWERRFPCEAGGQVMKPSARVRTLSEECGRRCSADPLELAWPGLPCS